MLAHSAAQPPDESQQICWAITVVPRENTLATKTSWYAMQIPDCTYHRNRISGKLMINKGNFHS